MLHSTIKLKLYLFRTLLLIFDFIGKKKEEREERYIK